MARSMGMRFSVAITCVAVIGRRLPDWHRVPALQEVLKVETVAHVVPATVADVPVGATWVNWLVGSVKALINTTGAFAAQADHDSEPPGGPGSVVS